MRCVLLVVLVLPLGAQEEAVEPARGLSPEAAARAMSLPEGFEARIFAAEPDVKQPIGYAVDERGRLWVAENYSYPNWAPTGKDRVLILEDTDGDGSADKRTVFHEGLNFVSGIQVGFGGVWIGSPPHLMFIPDRDGDDVPDGEPEILLDGWGHQDTHETLNAFTWGPDGWLYGCHGVFTHSKVGKPGTPDAERQPLNAGIWRYHPTRHEFEVFGWGTSNPWGLDFDEHGQCFSTACVIPHLFHIVQGGRYHRQAGQHFNKHIYEDIKTIADHRHEGWHRNRPRAKGHEATNDVGGGHAHAGALIYQGGKWPEEFHGSIFMNNIHAGRLNRDVLKRSGSGYVASHAPDFMFANDLWYRGLHILPAPDGNIYVSDWYDELVCHQQRPKDRSNGRIHKISYGTGAAEPVDYGKRPDRELVALLESDNVWETRVARRLLQERNATGTMEEEVPALLSDLLRSDRPVAVRLEALWALHVIGELAEETAAALLRDRNEFVRAWAIQLLCEDRELEPKWLATFEELAAKDPSSVVRLHLASALQRLPLDQRWEVARGLAGHAEDNGDHNLPLMIWYAVEPLTEADPARAMKLAMESRLERVTRFTARKLAAEAKTRPVVIGAMYPGLETTAPALQGVLEALRGRKGLTLLPIERDRLDALLGAKSEAVRSGAEELSRVFGTVGALEEVRKVALDPKRPLAARREAMELLARIRDGESLPVFVSLLQEPALRLAALRALALVPGEESGDTVFDLYPSLSAEEREVALTLLASRARDARLVIQGLRDGTIERSEVSPFLARQIAGYQGDELSHGIATHWGKVSSPPAALQEAMAAWKAKLTDAVLAKADLRNGRALYDRQCAICHELYGEGGDIGPGLTGSNRGDLGYLLENIIAPNLAIGKDYQLHVVTTKDGQAVSGLLKASDDHTLRVRTLNDTRVVEVKEIANHEVHPVSMMPEGLLNGLSDVEVRDLVGYLQGSEQAEHP